jgi:DNA replication and repair protein RecF
MYIKKLKLTNFRNYKKQKIELEKNINIFYGDNAQGKTNIIESIYISSIGKSFRTKKDNELINIENDENNAMIELEFEKSDRNGNIKIEINEKKNISVNGLKIKKLSEILGNVNIVLFSPDDINLFKGSPARRRKALDIMIGQLRPAYVYNLNMYLKTIDQRNNYLKQIKYENKSKEMLDIWDEKLAEYAENVCNYRNEFIKKIKNKIVDIHKKITQDNEIIEINFITDCLNKEKYLNILRKEREKDIYKGYTGKGIHRDDFNININGKSLDIYGSQGQHRTALLSLKITELKIIYDEIGEYPILLLDDFMSELDNKRRESLLNNIDNIQVIITCTEKMQVINKPQKIFQVKSGNISRIY